MANKRPHPIFPDRNPETVESKYSKGPWRLVECMETHLVYLENPPAYAELESELAWEKSYRKEKQARREREPLFARLSDFGKYLRKRVRPVPKIESLPVALARRRFHGQESVRMVDVGCGGGDFAYRLALRLEERTGKTVTPTGIEISKALAEKADRLFMTIGGRVIRGSALDGLHKLEDGAVDLMLMHSFLEHEINPRILLNRVGVKLSPRGLLIIKVPNFDSLNRRIRQGRWCGFRYPDHVNYFSPNNLKLLLGESGLHVYRMNFFDRLPTSDNMWVIAEKGGTSD